MQRYQDSKIKKLKIKDEGLMFYSFYLTIFKLYIRTLEAIFPASTIIISKELILTDTINSLKNDYLGELKKSIELKICKNRI